ncbi:hypothetical protein [Eubacterium ramulus]|nr:hypothetical protein [Eubacterium ramulus]
MLWTSDRFFDVVRYHFNEDAKETMQEKINWMLVTEASRMAVY